MASYAPGSVDRAGIEQALKSLKSQQVDIPPVIGGKELRPGKKIPITSPHNHSLVLGHYYQGGEAEVRLAVESALEASHTWAALPWEHRSAVFLKAADLMAGPYRYIMNAAAMLDLRVRRP